MISVSRSRWVNIDSLAGQPLYSLAPAIEEGQALCYINEGGLGKATVIAVPAATDKFIGFAYSYFTRPATLVSVESFTVPAATPFTVTLANTPLNATTSMLVKDSNNVNYTYNAAPTGTQYSVTGSVITVNATQAGLGLTVTYAYNPTVAQVQYLVGDGVAGQSTAAAVTGTIGLIRRGIVYTSNFDPVVDWATNPPLFVGANGNVSATASKPPINGYVYEAPSVDNPFLGLHFSTPI